MPIKDPEARRIAHREYMRTTWYPRNRKRHMELVDARDRRRAAKVHAVLDEMRRRPCADCQNRFPPICMDFDHVRGPKLDTVTRLVERGFALSVILAEIEKCDMVCSNCHRIRTWKRGQYKHRTDAGERLGSGGAHNPTTPGATPGSATNGPLA